MERSLSPQAQSMDGSRVILPRHLSVCAPVLRISNSFLKISICTCCVAVITHSHCYHQDFLFFMRHSLAAVFSVPYLLHLLLVWLGASQALGHHLTLGCRVGYLSKICSRNEKRKRIFRQTQGSAASHFMADVNYRRCYLQYCHLCTATRKAKRFGLLWTWHYRHRSFI